MNYAVENVTPFYPGLNGQPLQGGKVYFGSPSTNPVTNPVTVYWDSAGTQPALQPITISNGRTVRSDGTPARVYAPVDYSLLVQDAKGAQVFYVPTSQGSLLSSIRQTTTVDTFSGTGASATYTLSVTPAKNDTAVFVGGVYQQKSAYTLAGNQLTITAAAGVNNVEVESSLLLDYATISAAITASKNAAASSAAAAAVSRAQMLYIIQGSFDPGAPPTHRDDGSAVQNGDYASFTDNLFRRYNGATWVASDINTANLAASGGAASVGLSNLTATTVNDVLKQSSLQLAALGQASAPTLAINATAGNLNGTYYYAVTFITAYGESECGAEAGPISPANQQVNLTNIPVSGNALVTGRKIYRTAAGAADQVLKQLVATINDNVSTTYTDNIADASLGVSVPRVDTSGSVIYRNGARIASASQTTTVFGYQANPNNTGYANTAFGANAMFSNTTGYRNTAYGIFALYANTTGARNTAGGVHALNYNTTGNDNTSWGYAALMNAATSSLNTAIGSNALNAALTGNQNTAVGAQAGQLMTSGANNTPVGYNSLYATTSGSGNSALGSVAGQNITTGNFNAAMGMQTMSQLTTGSTNTGVGFQTLYSNSTGSGNVAIGAQAGYYETGSNALWIDNTSRANLADGKIKALMWGTFGTTPINQQLTVNGLLNPAAGLALPLRTPVTANYTQVASDAVISCGASGTIALTLLSGSSQIGRTLLVKTTTAQAVNSAAGNIIPITGGAAGTSILPATAGKWVLLQMVDSTNWEVMAGN